jgi:hypothetical protein
MGTAGWYLDTSRAVVPHSVRVIISFAFVSKDVFTADEQIDSSGESVEHLART